MHCKSCGVANPDGFRFCGGCGAALLSLDPPPASLTAKGLAERVSLEGERKLITALSADVQGSMDLAQTTDPEVWHRAMDGLFKLLCAGVHRFEGTVQRFTGDGVMALFGAPVAHEDHARRACYAALHVTEAIEAYAVELRRSSGLNFHVRIGINSGEVIVGTVGDDLDMQYTAIGHAVGLADRIQTLAAPGTPYVTESTAALIEGHLRLTDLGKFSVKGVRDDVRVFSVDGASGPRAAIEVARLRGFSGFVGRSREMAQLQDALARASDGDGQVIGVVGEPGVGKSRLCIEFAERCEARGITVWRTYGVAHGRTIPFLPVFQILRAYFGIEDDDVPLQVRERIAGRQVLLAPGFEGDLPLLFDFFGVADPARPATPVGSDERMRRVLAVVEALMRARSESRTAAVILLDDLQWFDSASLAFFQRVIEVARETRTLVLANFRPEMDWDHERVHVRPLDATAVGELTQTMLGRDESLKDLDVYVLDRTSGNPFFIEELVRALIEQGDLAGSPGNYRLISDLTRLNVPATVQAVLASRIDRLSAVEKSMLHAAAVIGRTFTRSLLTRVASSTDAIATLCEREFFDEVDLYPEPEYAFRHPLTREVAYNAQLTDQRMRVHRAVADAIIELDAENLDERAATIAHHAEAAGDALDAARWHERAGEWSFTRDLAAADAHWRSALDLVDDLSSEAAEDVRLASTVRILRVANRVGMPPESVDAICERALPVALRRDDTYALWAVNVSSGFNRLHAGEVEGGMEALREAAFQSSRSPDEALSLYGPAMVGLGLNYVGAPTAAVPEWEVVLRTTSGKDADLGARSLLGYRLRPFADAHRALTLTLLGRLEEASETVVTALHAAGDEPMTPIHARAHGAFAGWFAGTGEEALTLGREAVQSAGMWGAKVWGNLARVALGAGLVLSRQYDEAASVLDEALDEMRTHQRFAILEGVALSLIARTTVELEDFDRALAAADAAVEVGTRRGLLFGHPWALLARANVRARVGGPAELVEADLDDAERVIAATGQVVHQPFVHLERARLATGGVRDSELAMAAQLFRQFGAPARADAAMSGLH